MEATMNAQTISTSQLDAALEKTQLTLLDTRPMDAWNGWRLENEGRGGHIPGAVAFPLGWTEYDQWHELLEPKGITPEKEIVIYGYRDEDTSAMASLLADAGYENIRVYEDFLSRWVVDSSQPLEQLPRYEHLVPPQWLRARIDGASPEHFGNPDLVVCHSHYDIIEDYEKGHIPGAIALNTLDLESPDTWNRRSPEELEASLRAHGIRKDSTVVVYGRFSHPDNDDPFPGKSAGHLGAMRCALILLYAGVKDVRILNGGLMAWEAAGYETTTKPATAAPAADFGASIPAHPEYVVDLPGAKELIASSDGELVSVRSWEEYLGNVSGYNYVGPRGRIPGSVFGNCGSDAYHMENYRNVDHTMRPFTEVAANWAINRIVPDKHIAFYCGTGWRGSEAFFNAWLMGWPKVSLYDGGWFEWSSDPENPVATGAPE